MTEKELISLASQLTRCYSDNSRAPYQANLVVCSWGGQLKHRFDTVLNANHQNWKGVEFTPDDFVTASGRAQSSLLANNSHNADKRWNLNGTNSSQQHHHHSAPPLPTTSTPAADVTTTSSPFSNQPTISDSPGEIVYLTSDSPNTLTTLSPNSTYIIGGLVDRNRHKGICFHRATDRGIRTAKLPIAEFMEMQSRSVLATNHVVEIMVRWLEVRDWGDAFLSVIPKRKGGKLRVDRRDGDRDGIQEGEQEGGVEGDQEGDREEEDDDDRKDDEDEVVGEEDVDICVEAGGDDMDGGAGKGDMQENNENNES